MMGKYIDQNGLSKLSALIKTNGVKVQTVSYVGTGTSGEDNPNSITFDFAPKIVFYAGSLNVNGNYRNEYGFTYSNEYTKYSVLTPDLMSTSYDTVAFAPENVFSSLAKKSADGKTIYWYGVGHTEQLNSTPYRYYFIAIG